MTTPDLPHRLREFIRVHRDLDGRGYTSLMTEAADELERLRAQEAELKAFLRSRDAGIVERDRQLNQFRVLCADQAAAAHAVIARWDSPDWKDGRHTGELINALRTAITAAPAQQAGPTCPHDGQCHPGACPCSDARRAQQADPLLQALSDTVLPGEYEAQQAEPVAWPSGIDIADEIDTLLPVSMGYATRAAVEQWWRDLVARKLSRLAHPPAQGVEPFDLTEARTIVVDAIRRLRAAHAPSGDLERKAEAFLEATNAAAKPDELWSQTLRERDRYHEVADDLAQAIAKHLGVDIGEHSSANCPWDEALEAIAQAPAAEPLSEAALKRIHDGNAFLPDLCGLTNLWPGIVAFSRAVERAHGIGAA